MKLQVAKLISFFIVTFVFSPAIFACTDYRLTAKDNTVLITRTLEFPIDLKSNLRSAPRDKQVTAKAPNGGSGLSWKNKYGYLFVDAFDQNIVVDGMNEAGLSFEYLYLPGETQYPSVPAGKEAQSLPYYQLGEWVLGNFKTIDEVKKALADIYVYQARFPVDVADIQNVIFPLHASIYQADGKGIVIEFVNGKVTVYDNIGIMTNSPIYSWQVTNLRNYLNLSPYNPKAITVDGISYSATGQGSGSVGIPGDASPPSRFAKIAFLTTAAYPVNNKSDLLNLSEHIINNVDIPRGIARSVENGKESADYTQWTVFKDLTHKVIYYRTYNDLTLRMVDLNKVDFTDKTQPLKMPLTNPPYTMDMTSKFTGQMMGKKVINTRPTTKVTTDDDTKPAPRAKLTSKAYTHINPGLAARWGAVANASIASKTNTATKINEAINADTKNTTKSLTGKINAAENKN